MINYQILIDGVDYTSEVALPFKEQYVLDSALDNAVLTLPMIKRDTIFKPFTLFTIRKNNISKDMYIASDKMTEIVGTGLYTHELVLIEETKLLEKKVVDTNTTTQPLLHDYVGGTGYVCVTRTQQSLTTITTYEYDSRYNNIYLIGTELECTSAENWFPSSINLNINSLKITHNSTTTSYNPDVSPTIILGIGTYDFEYSATYTVDLTTIRYTDTFTITVISQPIIRHKKSITDVVNRLLAITETLRENETPKLKFNQRQAEFYDQRDIHNEPLYPAPEFSMSKNTLRECLDQVGSYIHSIVRLVGDTIYFDKLGGTEESTLDNDYIGSYETLANESSNTSRTI